ncbi:MAG: hypothetical protein HOV94_08640 [Saccharothrix sp.]|nr:hypothetical protein [Saccharothrix sp.]
MALGPVEYIAIEFPGDRFDGSIVPAVQDLVARAVVHVVDLVFVKKDRDGRVALVELAELDPEEAAPFDALEGDVTGLLSTDDVDAVARDLAPGTCAALLVWEDTWAARLAEAVSNAGGRVVAHDRVPAAAFAEAANARVQ